MRDEGATAVLGAVLMLSLMLMMVPSAVMLKSAISEEMDAQREAAERAAWCARHPEIGPPACVERGPLPGYRCEALAGGAWLCRLDADANLTVPPTPSAGAPLMHDEPLPLGG